jgi:DtxR family transcriptional regulator, Mn-dependent transcriptional regulator
MMAATPPIELTPALEDYLETIYELVRARKVARVKDIAAARDVKAGSVSPAMRRLADMGLIRYHQREYIDLTKEGEVAARRVMSRHKILRRFFFEVLRMEEGAADLEACSIEHNLSNDAMDRMVRLFEFMQACPEGQTNFIDRFHACPIVDATQPDCGYPCELDNGGQRIPRLSLFQLDPGKPAHVLRVDTDGAVRQRLLDMGLIPGARVVVDRAAPGGDPVWVRLLGSQMALRRKEAEAILVRED